MARRRISRLGFYVVGDIAYGCSNKMTCEKATARLRRERDLGRRVTIVKAYDMAAAKEDGFRYLDRLDRAMGRVS